MTLQRSTGELRRGGRNLGHYPEASALAFKILELVLGALRVSIGAEGRVFSDGTACPMAEGIARTVPAPHASIRRRYYWSTSLHASRRPARQPRRFQRGFPRLKSA